MSKVDDLRNRLFRERETFEEREGEPELDPLRVPESPHAWTDEHKRFDDIFIERRRRKRKIFVWTVSISIVVLVAIAGVLFFFLGSVGSVSPKNVRLSVVAPQKITAGDRIAFEVRFKNENRIPLESTELLFEFPEGSLPLFGNPPKGRLKERRAIGHLDAGEERIERFEAYLLGKETQELHSRATLEYRPSNSSARFDAATDFTTVVERSPIAVSLEFPEEVNIGQEMRIDITYVSSAQTDFRDLSLDIQYPLGFEFASSEPVPTLGNNMWHIGDLSPNETGTITVRGVLKGDANEKKNFAARIGHFTKETNTWGVYGDALRLVLLRAPLLAIEATAGGVKDYVVNAGGNVIFNFSWKNNLPVTVTDVIITADISGEVINYASVRVNRGTFDGANKRVVWNASSDPALKFVEPGETGRVSFTASLPQKLPVDNPGDQNFTAQVSAKIFSNVIPQGYEGVDISGKSSASIRVGTSFGFAANSYYYSDIIPNSGPLPPRVGEETTYMIRWSLSTLSNDADSVIVKAALPSYVKWKQNVVPSEENIKYNPNTGELVWDVGTIEAGTGVVRPAREVSFQVGIIPGPNHVGNAPDLVSSITATARDTFTKQNFKEIVGRITTAVRSDPRVSSTQYQVVQ